MGHIESKSCIYCMIVYYKILFTMLRLLGLNFGHEIL